MVCFVDNICLVIISGHCESESGKRDGDRWKIFSEHLINIYIPSNLLETSCVNESEQNLGERKTKEKRKYFAIFHF